MTPAEAAATLYAQGVRSLDELPHRRASAICAQTMSEDEFSEASEAAGRAIGHAQTLEWIRSLDGPNADAATASIALHYIFQAMYPAWCSINDELRALDAKTETAA